MAEQVPQAAQNATLTRAAARLSARVQARPDDMQAWLELSEAHQGLRHYRQAVHATRSAFAARRELPGPLLKLARQLRFFYEIGPLGQCLRMPAFVGGQDVNALVEMAISLAVLGDLELAEDFIGRAIKTLGDVPALLYWRASIHEYAGRMPPALADFGRALALDPGNADYLYALSRFPEGLSAPAQRQCLERALLGAKPTDEGTPLLHFAKFKVLDRLEEMDAAWSSLVRGNQLMKQRLDYRPTPDQELMRRLATLPARNPQVGGNEAPAPVPIFIVGLHRAGSTLLDLQLAADPQVRSLGESFGFPAQLRWACDTAFGGAVHPIVVEKFASLDLDEIGRRYRQHLRERVGDMAFVTEKLPMNYLNVGLILSSVAGARIVHIRRRPMDACFSNFKEIFRNVANYSYDFEDLAVHAAGYQRLMDAWHAKFPGSILDVEYEELVQTPEVVMRRVRAHCGLPEPGSGRATDVPMVSASSVQVRGAISTRHVGAWRRYARHLEPLRRALAAQGLDVDEN